MSVNFLYTNAFGRVVLKGLMNSGALKVAEHFMKTRASKVFIKPYIRRNNIDMTDYKGQKYNSFGDFFGRRRLMKQFSKDENVLISPCDSLLTVYQIDDKCKLHIKNSWYSIEDLIPNKEIADQYTDGLAMIFRLCATDYHHFCYIDDCYHNEEHYIEGKLHSVQPIACETVPVYRLNRRSWAILDTENFGKVAQIEVGALLVGGFAYEGTNRYVKRGQEMGHFELAGSTIVMLFSKDVKDRLRLVDSLGAAVNGTREIRVKQGENIAYYN